MTCGGSDRIAAKQDVIATAQRNIRSLQSLAKEDLVLRAVIPNYPDRQEIEVSKESWPLINAVVQFVTIALKSGVFPMASRPFPTYTGNP